MALKLARVAAGLYLAALATTATAQETSSNRVASNVDWNVFEDVNPTECWGVSAPKESVNTRDGRVVAVRRSEIQLFVTFRDASSAKGEISFTGGYPFAPGSTVNMAIGDSEFQLITEGEWAWPLEGQDGNIITAMKRGSKAVMTARSARGTQTQDTFSLLGFTAAVEDAEKRCSK
ncbi:MAG: invasion associated locus B family protein [Leisingera sp.]